MSLHFFAVPALDGGSAEEALNRWLFAQRVVQIERQFVADETRSFWAMCATVISGAGRKARAP